MDADDSQFVALMKVAAGRNLALEGPPGSGKSQTIVNAIANAIHQGQRVLFVAQKQTALEVVYSRLQALKLEKFVLPLVGSKGDTDSFYEALEDRINLVSTGVPNAIDNCRERLQVQKQGLSDYIELIQLEVHSTKISLHQLMGLAVHFHEQVEALPLAFRQASLDFSLLSGIFDLNAFNDLSSEMVSLCSQLKESKLDEGSPWADVDRDKAQFGSLSELRDNGNMALMQLEEHLRTLDAETRAKVDDIFASHTMERLEYVKIGRAHV